MVHVGTILEPVGEAELVASIDVIEMPWAVRCLEAWHNEEERPTVLTFLWPLESWRDEGSRGERNKSFQAGGTDDGWDGTDGPGHGKDKRMSRDRCVCCVSFIPAADWRACGTGEVGEPACLPFVVGLRH